MMRDSFLPKKRDEGGADVALFGYETRRPNAIRWWSYYVEWLTTSWKQGRKLLKTIEGEACS
jgi:hypothetical protein